LIARHKDGPGGFATFPLEEQGVLSQVFFECSAVRRDILEVAGTLHTTIAGAVARDTR